MASWCAELNLPSKYGVGMSYSICSTKANDQDLWSSSFLFSLFSLFYCMFLFSKPKSWLQKGQLHVFVLSPKCYFDLLRFFSLFVITCNVSSDDNVAVFTNHPIRLIKHAWRHVSRSQRGGLIINILQEPSPYSLCSVVEALSYRCSALYLRTYW